MNKRNAVGEGAGLVLTRKVGERIIIGADPDATDEQILSAIRGGMVVSLVEVAQARRPISKGQDRQAPGRDATAEEKSMHAAQAQARTFITGKGSARIGFKVDRAISITREEILQQAEQATA
jgi:sRNA-binding carbon storage regulator CsrA